MPLRRSELHRGDTLEGLVPMPRYRTSFATTEERFWFGVDKNGPIPLNKPELGPCWLWTRAQNGVGYGQVCIGNEKSMLAHRFSYQLHHGPIPKDKPFVCHACDNRGCVNPAPLFAGSAKDNQHDMMVKGRGNKVIGERSPTAKLNADKVREIRRLDALGTSRSALAAQFSVTLRTIDSIRYRDTWDQVE